MFVWRVDRIVINNKPQPCISSDIILSRLSQRRLKKKEELLTLGAGWGISQRVEPEQSAGSGKSHHLQSACSGTFPPEYVAAPLKAAGRGVFGPDTEGLCIRAVKTLRRVICFAENGSGLNEKSKRGEQEASTTQRPSSWPPAADNRSSVLPCLCAKA